LKAAVDLSQAYTSAGVTQRVARCHAREPFKGRLGA